VTEITSPIIIIIVVVVVVVAGVLR